MKPAFMIVGIYKRPGGVTDVRPLAILVDDRTATDLYEAPGGPELIEGGE